MGEIIEGVRGKREVVHRAEEEPLDLAERARHIGPGALDLVIDQIVGHQLVGVELVFIGLSLTIGARAAVVVVIAIVIDPLDFGRLALGRSLALLGLDGRLFGPLGRRLGELGAGAAASPLGGHLIL